MKKMFLIVGLGNPGREYQKTRHNLGFMAVDRLAQELKLASGDFSRQLGARVARAVYKRHRLILAKPQTFMNLSGQAVVSLLHYYKIPLDNLIIIHDEMDLDFGRLKIKLSGGTAGHKGLESIVAATGRGDFCRVRLGIGRTASGAAKDYVLKKFSADETGALDGLLEQAAAAVLMALDKGFPPAMNFFNS